MIAQLLPGLYVTLELTGAASVVGLVAAGLGAVGRISCHRSLRLVASVYVEFFRGVPVLALLIVAYFVVGPDLAIVHVQTFWLAAFALGLVEGSYLAEIWRAVVEAVSGAQWEASAALGLSRRQCLWRVIVPQSVVPSIPAGINTVIYTIKDSTFASLITVQELTATAQTEISHTFVPMKYFLGIMVIYLIVTVLLAYAGKEIERRVSLRLGVQVMGGNRKRWVRALMV